MDDVKSQLQEARERLAAFEEASARDHLLERLRAQTPLHPFVLARNVAAAGGFGLVALGLISMAVPLMGYDYARQAHNLQDALGFPVAIAFFVLAMCGIAGAFAMHQLALGAARNAPLLPTEAKNHQRLVADVKQLESRLALEGTPRPVARITR